VVKTRRTILKYDTAAGLTSKIVMRLGFQSGRRLRP
jgi:hypothetical protein